MVLFAVNASHHWSRPLLAVWERMILPDTQRGKEATERLQINKNSSVTSCFRDEVQHRSSLVSNPLCPHFASARLGSVVSIDEVRHREMKELSQSIPADHVLHRPSTPSSSFINQEASA